MLLRRGEAAERILGRLSVQQKGVKDEELMKPTIVSFRLRQQLQEIVSQV